MPHHIMNPCLIHFGLSPKFTFYNLYFRLKGLFLGGPKLIHRGAEEALHKASGYYIYILCLDIVIISLSHIQFKSFCNLLVLY